MIVVVKPQITNVTVTPELTTQITIPTDPSSITAFSDVLITNIQENQVLTYSLGKWRNEDAIAAQDSNFVFDQAIASNTWVITHNLSKYPSVTIVDSAGDEIEGDISYQNTQQLTVVFSASFGRKSIFKLKVPSKVQYKRNKKWHVSF